MRAPLTDVSLKIVKKSSVAMVTPMGEQSQLPSWASKQWPSRVVNQLNQFWNSLLTQINARWCEQRVQLATSSQSLKLLQMAGSARPTSSKLPITQITAAGDKEVLGQVKWGNRRKELRLKVYPRVFDHYGNTRRGHSYHSNTKRRPLLPW